MRGTYRSSPMMNPCGPSQGNYRVAVGASSCDAPYYCRLAFRMSLPPAYLGTNVGFRVARSLPTEMSAS